MPPTHPPYPSELKRQIVELVRAGRSPAELVESSIWNSATASKAG